MFLSFVSFFIFQGDVQPIAAQLIDFAKKKSSRDNISVIVLFFKDPKKILLNLKSNRMEYENGTNGCHQLAPDHLIGERNITPSPDNHMMTDMDAKMHVDLKQATTTATAAEHPEFFFGNGNGDNGDNGNGDMHSTTETIESSNETPSNGDDKLLSDNHFMIDNNEHDDFGPETDVDATDEALSPVEQASGVFISNDIHVHATNEYADQYDYKLIEEKPIENENAMITGDHHLVDEDTNKKNENDFNDDAHNDFIEDNRLIDNVLLHGNHDSNEQYQQQLDMHADEQHQVHDVDDELNDKIDFSEKKEYSFEREDFDKEIEPNSDFANAVLNTISKEAAVAAADDEKERDEDDDDGETGDIAEIISTVEQQSK